MAAARFTAAGRRLRTTGRAATTNGRIWFCTIGAPGTASAVSAWLAPFSALAAGQQVRGRRPELLGERLHLGERRGRLVERARQVARPRG